MKFKPESNDETLIKGCLEENRLAQKYLYQRYFGQMLGICMRYSKGREEATEILNMAFLKVFKSIHLYQPTGSFAGWIARIVFNTAIDHVRKHARYKKVMDFESKKELHTQNDAIDHLATEELFEMIQQLPITSRTVFSMYVIDGFKHREIAKELNISEGTSKWHLSVARKKLQEFINHYNRVDIRI